MFPLYPAGKKPLYRSPHPGQRCPGRWSANGCGRDGHGVLDATADPHVIEMWWRRQPRANVGIACGITAAGCGPDVVDIDVKDDAGGERSHTRLRDAGLLRGKFAVALTPSGGWHLYYEGTRQGIGTVKGFGIDFRSNGGYVVAPGSATPAGTYRWYQVPALDVGGTVDWYKIKEFLRPSPPPRPPVKAPNLLDDSLRGLADWLTTQHTGNRQAALHWACCKALESGHPPQALDTLGDAARRCGLDEADVRKALRSARGKFAPAAHA